MDGDMIKIAISGQARTGKNTLAQMIVDNLNMDPSHYMIVAVADPIKNMVLQMIPNADPECLWGISELRAKELPGNLKDVDGNRLTYRKLLTDIGKFGRLYHDDVWLNALVNFASKNKSLKAFIVADVRFINEINHLKEHGFHMIRLKRQDIPQIDDVSETAQLEIPDSFFHSVINNDGGLDLLDQEAKTILHKLALS